MVTHLHNINISLAFFSNAKNTYPTKTNNGCYPDSYIPKITKRLRDPCEVVRRQTFILLSRLLQVFLFSTDSLSSVVENSSLDDE